MNPFADAEPLRIAINKDPEMWVDLRRELTIGVEDAFNAKMFAAKFDREKAIAGKLDLKDIDLDIDLGRAMSNAAKLEMWIVDWQMFDKAGNEVPLNAAGISKLNKATATVLLDAIKGIEARGDDLGEESSAPATVT